MAARNQHEWHETTDAGEKREIRAVKFGKQWKLQSKLRDQVQWTYHDNPLLADLEALHDVLFRKYQRRRAPYEDVQAIEKLIAERKPADGTPLSEGESEEA